MATYKVIQDIEAEDKFLGPLTLKQFIFGAAAVLFSYLSFIAVAKGAAFLLVVFLPPVLAGVFLAIPWSKQQSTEVWALAKLRFMLKPRTRIWDQAGLEELVTITVPKKIQKVFTDGLDQSEVRSRLKALADTIDTRGWAVKNASLSDSYAVAYQPTEQRLIDLDTLPRQVPDVDLAQYVDMLDEDNVVSENFEHMIQESSTEIKQRQIDKMNRVRNGEPLTPITQPEIRFTPPPASPAEAQEQVIDEQLLSRQLMNKRQARNSANTHMKTLSVYPEASPAVHADASESRAISEQKKAPEKPQAEMTKTPDADILKLARNNDWTVDTIARNAKRTDAEDNEVVVSLR